MAGYDPQLLATFLAVLPAELPDKTILACLILSSRYRPSVVFSGAAAALPGLRVIFHPEP